MTLDMHPIHPTAGSYVLRLRGDAEPRLGRLSGRLEHIVSGDCLDFGSGEELLAWLLLHAAQALPPLNDNEVPR